MAPSVQALYFKKMRKLALGNRDDVVTGRSRQIRDKKPPLPPPARAPLPHLPLAFATRTNRPLTSVPRCPCVQIFCRVEEEKQEDRSRV